LLFFTPDGVKDIVQAYQLGQLGDSSWESMDNIPGLPRDLFAFLKAMNAFILDFENWWKLPLSDYSKLISTIHEDLHSLKKSSESISLLVGTLVEIDDLNFPDAWNATAYAAHCFATLPELTAIHDKLTAHQTTIEQMPQLWHEVQALHSDMVVTLETLDKFENRFVAIQPILQTVCSLQQSFADLTQHFSTSHQLPLRGSPPSFTRPTTPA
jgi:hypothetical protein